MTNLSEHFTFDELVYSETATRARIVNEPNAMELANLVTLCETLLEPARGMLGPLAVNSGYRCEALNRKIGGVPTSAHQDGRAADVKPISMSLEKAFEILKSSDLLFDQVILEPTWLHLGIAKEGIEPRRQALIAHPTHHGLVYERVPLT